MILRAYFTLIVEGKPARISGDVFDKDMAIVVNDHSLGKLRIENGRYTSKNCLLAKIAEPVIKNYQAIKARLKWNLPTPLRNSITWAKIDTDQNFLILAINEDYTLEQYETALKAALLKNNIQPDLKIKLNHPRFLSWRDVVL